MAEGARGLNTELNRWLHGPILDGQRQPTAAANREGTIREPGDLFWKHFRIIVAAAGAGAVAEAVVENARENNNKMMKRSEVEINSQEREEEALEAESAADFESK